jgi:hypothetical protein
LTDDNFTIIDPVLTVLHPHFAGARRDTGLRKPWIVAILSVRLAFGVREYVIEHEFILTGRYAYPAAYASVGFDHESFPSH